MLEYILSIAVLLSVFIHLSYIKATSETKRDNYYLQKIYCTIIDHDRPKWQKSLAMDLLGTLWALIYIYHFMISKLLQPLIMLNLLNIMTTVLTSACFIELSYRLASTNSNARSSNDLFYTTVAYWEFVLAGVVILSLIMNF